ncbi:MAG: DUF58 domain-containing protein [Omnitrophica WOR_2 bacterium]
MGRLVFLVCLIYALLLLGLATLDGRLVALAIPMMVFLLSALYFAPGEVQISITRSLSDNCVSTGIPVEVITRITNTGAELEEVLLEVDIPPGLELLKGETRVLAALPVNGINELSYTVRGSRGRHVFPEVRVSAVDQLGVFRRRKSFSAPAALLIKPQPWKLKPVPIRPRLAHGYTGFIPTRSGGAGVNFYGVREYQTGDPLRRINWKVTARRDEEMFTNEFEQERITDVGLILDARQRTNIQVKEDSLFEHSVRATASLAEAFLHDGNRVGLLIYGRGREMTFPGYGRVQLERILRSLAQAQSGDNQALESFVYLPTRFFPARSQIVFISPLINDDLPVLISLRSYGYHILVVSPDPFLFEGASYQPDVNQKLAIRLARIERVLLLRKLQRAGVRVVDWPVVQPLNQVMHTALYRAAMENPVGGSGR